MKRSSKIAPGLHHREGDSYFTQYPVYPWPVRIAAGTVYVAAAIGAIWWLL